MGMYWTQETENAIIEYNASENYIERSNIYRLKIRKPLEKMVEYIINTYKFDYINYSLRDKKADVVSHIIMNIHKFDPSKGASFGYFSTVAKFYLIQANTAAVKKQKSDKSINKDLDENGDDSYVLQIEDTVINETNNIEKSEYLIELMIKYLEKHLDILIYKENEKKVVFAIMQVLENYKNIEKFNKKAIYLILREMTNEQPIIITSVINRLREFYLILSDVYHKYSEIPEEWVYKRNKYSHKFF